MAHSTDRYGFPIQVCGRCGGSGSFSYNSLDGSLCYGCNGSGYRHTRKASKAHADFVTASKAVIRPSLKDLQPGDEVRWVKEDSYMVVKSVVDTGEECGWSIAVVDGVEVRTVTSTRVIVSFVDGTETSPMSGDIAIRRKGSVDPAPFVARSLTQVRKLKTA